MKKSIRILIVACLLCLLQVVPVYAAPDENAIAQTISGYCLGDELYAFVRMNDGFDVNNFQVTLQSDEIASDETAGISLITETSSVVRYVFMIDLTGSMRKYTEQVNAFLDALTGAEKQDAFYTIATFGERFTVVSENLTDKNAVKKVLEELEYNEQLTDPYTGVESAITYFDNASRKSGDLINLIVITDGDPDLGYEDEAESLRVEEELAASLTEKIKHTPEIIISTLCTAQWDENAIAALGNGNGIHELIQDEEEANAAGVKMANYIDSLYRTSFALSKTSKADRFSIMLKMRGNDLNGNIAMLDLPIENIPALKAYANETEAPDTEESVKEPETGEIQGGIEIAPSDTKTEGDVGTESATETPGDTENEVTETEAEIVTDEGTDNSTIVYIAIIAACVLVVTIICTIILLKRKKKNKAQVAQENPAGKIPMKLEVFSGNCLTKATLLYLGETFTIGSGSTCDLIFTGADIAQVHARLIMHNNMIVIEDLSSLGGTYLGGMRIQGQNRLRSGDVISIGDAEFSLKF